MDTDERYRHMTLRDLANEALALQYASNVNGVLRTAWHVTCELTRRLGSTEAAARHPIALVILHKISDMSLVRHVDGDTFSAVEEIASGMNSAVECLDDEVSRGRDL